jgi:hypothetical protein
MGHGIRINDAPLAAALASADNRLYRLPRKRRYNGR